MSKFKVGDKAILIKDGLSTRGFKVGDEVEIVACDLPYSCQYKIRKKKSIGFANDVQLELVEEPTIKTTELKIDSDEIRITAKPSKITADDLNAIGNYEIKFNKELYNRHVLGIWTKEEKEGNKMIESMNLIDLYANKHKESIEKETKEKVEELRKNCDVINKYIQLEEQFKKDCDELYLSQFTEEEKNKILVNQDIIDDNDMQLRKDGCREFGYYTNKNFHTDEYYDVMNDRNKKLSEIDDLVKMVKAHVGIAKTKEEVEEILDRYGIIKKGKLVTK